MRQLGTRPEGLVAERVGFEPTVPQNGTPVFETGTLNHSDTSPRCGFSQYYRIRHTPSAIVAGC